MNIIFQKAVDDFTSGVTADRDKQIMEAMPEGASITDVSCAYHRSSGLCEYSVNGKVFITMTGVDIKCEGDSITAKWQKG